jgi:oligopeptidase B
MSLATRFCGLCAAPVLLLVIHCFDEGLISTASAQHPLPPQAAQRPHEMEIHADKRIDEFYWMRERENPEVIHWLEAENAYREAVMAGYKPLEEKLVQELRDRIKQDDESVAYPDHGYDWFTRIRDGQQYPNFYRRKHDSTSNAGNRTGSNSQKNEAAISAADHAVELVLDQNALAEGKDYCSVAGIRSRPAGDIVAWSVDFVGRRKYTIQFKNQRTGDMLNDEILDTTGSFVFAEDNQHLFYTRQDSDTLRAFQVFCHKLGTDPQSDRLVFEETDEEFSVSIDLSKSRQYLMIASGQTLSTEYRLLDSKNVDAEPVVFLPRQREHEYHVDHLNDQFVIRTNWQAPNFRLMHVNQPGADPSQWKELVLHRAEVLLQDFELLKDWLVVEERVNGLTQIRYRQWNDAGFQTLSFGEPCYSATLAATNQKDTNFLRYSFSSLKTPHSIIQYNLENGEKVVLKQDEILGGFDSANYISQRLWATAADGARVPLGVLRHKDTPIDGTAPLLIYGYGSYGYSEEDDFNPAVLNLVNRGFVFAVAHIRGGQEMGRHWYEDGKLLKKKNTFTDFIDCTRFLIERNYADPKRVYAQGGSAGGLLMGAVMNMAPDLYHGVIADVPFVDVVTTMLDDSIPLTTSEYDEWGNPNQLEYYQYMLSYSPYENVQRRDYPHLLVTTGLHDSQVQYWEPAKWVARLRTRKTDQNLLLLHTEMSAGHGGSSGRYQRYRETAMRQVFLLMLAGISN